MARIARDGLAYGPDGSIWASIDARLSRYENGAWSDAADIQPGSPLSVAPDGAIWFVSQNSESARALVDRLLPGEATAEPTPTASPQVELRARNGAATRLLAVDSEQAWATRSGDWMQDWLWRRDAAGWTGPIGLEDTVANPRSTVNVRGLAELADRRLALATDTGLWVGGEGAWTRAWAGEAWDVAVAPDRRLWVTGPGWGSSTLRVLRETAVGWQEDWSGCRSGGNAVAIAADGSVWTAGITYSSMGGVARVQDGTCEEMHPLGGGRDDEVVGIAASPSGLIAVHVLDPLVDDVATGGRVLQWQDGRWTELRAGSDLIGMWHALAYTPEGALWATFAGSLSRYAGGQWQQVTTAMQQAPISVATDGTVWYVRADGVIDRLQPSDVNAAIDSLKSPDP